MQIEQVIGGVNGDTTAQAIQLRMRTAGQSFVSGAKLVAFDATGSNPINLIVFPNNVTNSAAGSRILITSANFGDHTNPGLVSDFTLTNLIPASYLAAGKIAFIGPDNNIYWSLSYGGSAYTGTSVGALTNDSDGNFGPPFAGPLPSNSLAALRFDGVSTDPSTTNAADYALSASPAVFTNNAGTNFTVIAGVPRLSIGNVRIREGNGGTRNAVFTVTLSFATNKIVVADYFTVNATTANAAQSGVDYGATSGRVAFLPGETTQVIKVAIVGDGEIEENEVFKVRLARPRSATINDATATGIIVNDDTSTTSN
jgi:hypothetical protein